jgi:hypothetical protein
MNAQEGDGEDSPPTDSESEDEDEDRNCWLRNNDSLNVACPGFLRVGRLDQPGHSET